jgi:shikimate kinase
MTRSSLAPILLCGFMGSGKSTLLKVIQKSAPPEWIFRDLDQAILASEKKFASISALVDECGWDLFRRIERDTLRACCQQAKNQVLALGGGSLEKGVAQEMIQQKALLVWLDTPFEICWERVRHDASRPLVAMGYDELKKLYEHRYPTYQQAQVHCTLDAQRKIQSWRDFDKALEVVKLD